MNNRERIVGVVGALFASALPLVAANVAASTTPPGGIAVNKAPLFVNIGWDDNTSAEGLVWATSLFEGKTNPDGTPQSSSFYMNSTTLKSDAALVTQINTLVNSVHELGNHTYDHQDSIGYLFDAVDGPGSTYGWNKMTKFLRNEATQTDWSAIIAKGADSLVARTNADKASLTGFRAPYLEFGTNLFPALKSLGYRYDCSIETNSDGFGEWVWPYTLDNGSDSHDNSWKNNSSNYIDLDGDTNTTNDVVPYNFPINSTAGLWEMPSYALLIPDDATCSQYGITPGLRTRIQSKITWMTASDVHITGFDYNLWNKGEGSPGLSKVEALGILKYNLDLRIAGNRAPFFFGAHSQYYVGTWAATNANATQAEMKACITEFLAYAASKSEVRITAMNNVVDWMENPTELSTTPVNTAPSAISLSPSTVSVNATVGTTVGNLSSTDQFGNTHTYAFVSGSGFAVSSAGVVTVASALQVGNAVIRVRSTDQGGLSLEKDITIAVTTGTVVADYVEVLDLATWEIAKDAIGSQGSVVHDTGVSVVGTLNLGALQVSGSDTLWPWVSMNAYLDTTFDKVTEVEVTYTATEDIAMSFSTDTYGYSVTLVKGTHTTKVALSDFTFSWANAGTPPLVIKDISSVGFDAVVEGTTTVTITSLKLYGYVPPTAVVPVTKPTKSSAAKSVRVLGVRSGRVELSVPTAGRYGVSFYSVDGRLISQQSLALGAGTTSLALEKGYARGLMLVRVQGAAGVITQKILLP